METKKNHNTIETFIEATNNEISKERAYLTTKIFKPFKKRTKSSRRSTRKRWYCSC